MSKVGPGDRGTDDTYSVKDEESLNFRQWRRFDLKPPKYSSRVYLFLFDTNDDDEGFGVPSTNVLYYRPRGSREEDISSWVVLVYTHYPPHRVDLRTGSSSELGWLIRLLYLDPANSYL